MIIAYHVVFTTYGTGLPNNPRGSYTKEIYNRQLRLLGEIKYGRHNTDPARRDLLQLGINVPACAIMNDHVHILILRSKYKIEYIVNQLKGTATGALKLHHTPWARGYWKVSIKDTAALTAAIRYIQSNPLYSGFSAQNWDFITPLHANSV